MVDEIFSSSDFVAKVLIAIISASTAMIVLIFTLFFTNRRSKKDILIKKIEEVYLHALDYRMISYQVIDLCEKLISEKNLSRPNKGKVEGIRQEIFVNNKKLLEIRAKLEMMRDLYLPDLPFDRDSFNPSCSVRCLHSAIFEDIDEDNKESSMSSFSHCHDLVEKLLDYCLLEVKRRMHRSYF